MNNEAKQCQCPQCGYINHANLFELGWMEELPILLTKHSGLGVDPDIAGMSIIELWGIYQYLLNR